MKSGNKKSELIFKQRKILKFNKIFELLDSDFDN